MGSSRWQRSGDELLRELAELESQSRRLYSASLELITELETRGVTIERGYPGLPHLLRDVLRIDLGEARRRIQHANAVTDVPIVSGGTMPAPLPAAAVAARAGTLGADHLDVIVKAVSGLPPHVPPVERDAAERTLVTAAASLDARTLAKVGTRLRAVLDQDGTPPDEVELTNPVNELRFTTRSNGRTAFRGEFAPESSALFHVVLSALARPRPNDGAGPDPRTAAERHGDAMVEVLRLAADSGGLPGEAGEKPHLLVTVPLQALRLGVGHALLDGAGHLDAASARRIACDSKVIPAVLGARSEPLDIGRAGYTVPTALRRSLILRDRGCAFPGCDRPHRWCHGHHIEHWADNGRTELDNLVLLCGHHHRLIHHSDWRCAIVDGQAEFVPPKFIDPEQEPRRNILHPSLT